MPQTGGKDKSSSKRHFTVVVGTKEHGLYCSSSPSSAARKAVSKLCGKEKGKKVEFCIREITQGSKKKTYGPYLGHVEKLAKPIQLKGRLVERMPVARLKAKSSAKKGGMRGRKNNNKENIHEIELTPLPNKTRKGRSEKNTGYKPVMGEDFASFLHNPKNVIGHFKKNYKSARNSGININGVIKFYKNIGLGEETLQKAISSIQNK